MQDEATAATTLPERIGKYPVLALLGRGATSTVYRARDPFGGHDVAIKLIDPEVFSDKTDPLAKTGFLVEANLVGKLDHPHLAKIHDVVATAGEHFVVMEYVPGGTIERYCQPGSLMDAESAVDVVFKAAKALEYVQSLGLVHRDIKPANILIHEGTDVRVADFGAAQTRLLSQTHRIRAGSPLYMSPEQVKGEEIGFHSDMYSLTAVLYQLLTGQPPFQGGSLESLTHQIVERLPEPPSRLREGLPRNVDGFIARALAKRPDDRFTSWADYCAALEAIDAGEVAPEVAQISLDAGLERYKLLRRNPFFAGFADALLWEVIERAQFRRLVRGDLIMREGDLGDLFHILLAGEVQVTKSGRLINVYTAGASLGEMTYILEERLARTATCVCFTDAILLEIPNAWLRDASEACRSAFERTFLRQVAMRLLAANARLLQG